MIDGDDEFEMLDEIDKWRFTTFTVLELRNKKPVLLDKTYLSRKGFDFKKKSLEKTLEAISPFIEICNIGVTKCNGSVTQNRIDKNIIEKNIIEKDKKKYLELVFLSGEEYKKLIERFGEKGTADRIENLNRYGHQKPKKFKEYGSHYHTILTWESRNPKEKPGYDLAESMKKHGLTNESD